MLFHGIYDPGDSSGNPKAYEPPEHELLARRQARILDSLAYILVSQAKKDVVAVGVIVTNPGSPRAGSDPDSGSEHSPSAIEVLIANNGMIEDDAREYLEYLSPFEKSERRIPESKGHHVEGWIPSSRTLPRPMKSRSSILSCQSWNVYGLSWLSALKNPIETPHSSRL